MVNYIAPLVVAVVMGAMHLICLCGVLFLRSAPVFAARVPKVVLGSVAAKCLGFVLGSWLFLDPQCPCGVVPFMFWVDWTGSCWLVLKRVILLFRYEIQAELNRSKAESSIPTLDEKNLFVRYRRILKPSTQTWAMVWITVILGAGHMTVLGVYNEHALEPCIDDLFVENNLLLGSISWTWIVSGPMLVVSVWASYNLKKFPLDNWKMGKENSIQSLLTVVAATACAITLGVIPHFEGILWVLYAGSISVNLLQFWLPVSLHRDTIKQLATLDLKTLSSFDHLLLNEDFLDAFGTFLKKEFSSENLFFWLEVNRLQHQFGALLPADQRPPNFQEVVVLDRAKLSSDAAHACSALGRRCVGENAPCQLNISGFTEETLERDLASLNEMIVKGSASDLAVAVEETFKVFGEAQFEVYELLRKDPYPRFLLTSAATTLNKNETFKRLLASEKLEEEVQKSLGNSKGSKKHTNSADESSEKEESSKKSKKASENEKKKNRPSQLLAHITDTQRNERSQSENIRSSSVDSSVIEMGSEKNEDSDRRPSDVTLESPRFLALPKLGLSLSGSQ